jgi:uncharacterized protein YdaU (DUF1376 family)
VVSKGQTAHDKLLAEWFWTDRWAGSSAFLLPMEPRGVYREMLTQSWRRGARLPNDHQAICRAIGATAEEWARSWPLIAPYWRVEGGYLVNDTQLDVYNEAKARAEGASDRGRKGAAARYQQRHAGAQVSAQAPAQASTQAPARAPLGISPPSPSPSPSPIMRRPEKDQAAAAAATRPQSPRPVDARSNHPVFKGQRFTIFDWQLEDLMRLLGPHSADFDLHQWFYDLDTATGVVLPATREERWAWLQRALVTEARRRGLPVASAEPSADDVLARIIKAGPSR